MSLRRAIPVLLAGCLVVPVALVTLAAITIAPALAETREDATLDPRFGGDGIVSVSFDLDPQTPADYFEDVFADGAGGLWVVGIAHTGLSNYRFAAAHLGREGQLLGKFTDPAVEWNSSSGSGEMYAFGVVDSQGRLLVVIATAECVPQGCISRMFRYLSAGARDSQFAGGELTLYGNTISPSAVSVQPNGEIWVAGYQQQQTGFVRVSDAGVIGEFVPTPSVLDRFASPQSPRLALTNEQAGEAGRVVRLDPSGAADLSFDGDGVMPLYGAASACAPQAETLRPTVLAATIDGRFVIHGNVLDPGNSQAPPLATYLLGVDAAGAPGPVHCLPAAQAPYANGVAVRADGRVFVVSAIAGMGMEVRQMSAHGSIAPDPAFNAGQPLSIPVPGTSGGGYAKRVILDGPSPVLAGEGRFAGNGNWDWVIVRLVGDTRLFSDGF
jgi:hypothetical protein